MPCSQVLTSLWQLLLKPIHVPFDTWSSRMLHYTEGRRIRRLKEKVAQFPCERKHRNFKTNVFRAKRLFIKQTAKETSSASYERLKYESNKFLKYLMLYLFVSQITTQGWKEFIYGRMGPTRHTLPNLCNFLESDNPLPKPCHMRASPMLEQ